MPMTQEEICSLLPHAGSMCLIGHVQSWNEEQIICLADSHRAPGHPLLEDGRLSAIHAVEYGAQAMGIHRGLLAYQDPASHCPNGYIAAIRGLRLHRRYLHDLASPLTIKANHLGDQGGSFVYAIEVLAENTAVLEARITIMTQSGNAP